MFPSIFISLKDFAARIFIGWVVTENLFSPGDKKVGKLLDSLELTFLENFLIWLLKNLNIFSLSFFLSNLPFYLSLTHWVSFVTFSLLSSNLSTWFYDFSLLLNEYLTVSSLSLYLLSLQSIFLSPDLKFEVPLPLSSKLVSLPNSLSLPFNQHSLSLSLFLIF